MRVNPNCYSVKMGDGTVYPADRQGLVNITNPAHQREISTSHNKKNLDLFSDPVGTFVNSSDPGKPCTECSFVGWGWQKTCPSGHQLGAA